MATDETQVRVLVTGGAGFIGSHVVEACLARGYEVWIADDLSTGALENVPREILDAGRLVQVDVREGLDAVAPGLPFDAVFHLAAKINLRESFDKPEEYHDVNVRGAVRAAEFCSARGARSLVFSSSAAVYAPEVPIPAPEEALAAPASPYGESKLAAERELAALAARGGFRCAALRYANAYGPRQAYSAQTGFLAILVNRSLRGEPLSIFGDGEQTRDFVYVEDIAAANLHAFGAALDGVYNVGTGAETSVNQTMRAVAAALGGHVLHSYGKSVRGEVRRSALDASRLRATGWAPSVSPAVGLARTVAYYRDRQ